MHTHLETINQSLCGSGVVSRRGAFINCALLSITTANNQTWVTLSHWKMFSCPKQSFHRPFEVRRLPDRNRITKLGASRHKSKKKLSEKLIFRTYSILPHNTKVKSLLKRYLAGGLAYYLIVASYILSFGKCQNQYLVKTFAAL